MNAIKGVVYLLLAVLSITIGLAIIIWVLYNIFIEVQPEYTGPTLITSLASFGISIPMVSMGIFWFRKGYAYFRK